MWCQARTRWSLAALLAEYGLLGSYLFSSVKAGSVGRQRAVDLVGRHVQEAEGRLLLGRQRAPVAAHGFEQPEGAEHVGLDEVLGPVDGAVHVGFGREVDDGARLVLGQQAVDQRAVADVALHEDVVRIALERRQGLEVAGIGQLVEVDDGLVALREPVENEIGADEAGAPGYQDHGGPSLLSNVKCRLRGARTGDYPIQRMFQFAARTLRSTPPPPTAARVADHPKDDLMPTSDDDKPTDRIKDSAQQIWLAGLGAFAKMQQEGSKAFEALVKDGAGVQKKTQQAAEETLAQAQAGWPASPASSAPRPRAGGASSRTSSRSASPAPSTSSACRRPRKWRPCGPGSRRSRRSCKRQAAPPRRPRLPQDRRAARLPRTAKPSRRHKTRQTAERDRR